MLNIKLNDTAIVVIMARHNHTGGFRVMLRQRNLALVFVVAEFRVNIVHADMHKASIAGVKVAASSNFSIALPAVSCFRDCITCCI